MKKLTCFISIVMVAALFSSCSSTVTTDDFGKAVQNGMEDRWAYQDSADPIDDTNFAKEYGAAVDKELSRVSKYKDAEFEDPEVAKIAEEYIDTLEAQSKLCEDDAYDYWTMDYNFMALQWYRRNAINALSKKYTFTFAGQNLEIYKDMMNDKKNAFVARMKENPKQVEEAFTILDSKAEAEYDWYSCKVKVKNNTDALFPSFAIIYRTKSSDGTTIESENYAHIDNFEAGSTTWTNEFGSDLKPGYTIEVYAYVAGEEAYSTDWPVELDKPITIKIK